MAEYTKVFDNPYPNGWEDLPSENTPITASALQEHTDAIEHIENYLNKNPITGGTSVEWEQIQTSGTKIAEISIDGFPQDVFVPEGSKWTNIEGKPFSSIGDGLIVDENGKLVNEIKVQEFEKVKTDLNNKQNKTDNSLNTSAKTVVGAINEVNTETEKCLKEVERLEIKANSSVTKTYTNKNTLLVIARPDAVSTSAYGMWLLIMSSSGNNCTLIPISVGAALTGSTNGNTVTFSSTSGGIVKVLLYNIL